MGRRMRLIEKILEGIDVKDDDGEYIVVYDISPKPPKEFYNNLSAAVDYEPLTKSSILVRGLRSALAVKKLIIHYRGDVRVFKVEKEV